jgi:hypothetical protein
LSGPEEESRERAQQEAQYGEVAKVFAELDSRQRDIKRAKERDKQAISYAIWKLKADPEDQRPSEARRERMRDATKASTMRKRLASRILDFLILIRVLISCSVEKNKDAASFIANILKSKTPAKSTNGTGQSATLIKKKPLLRDPHTHSKQ